MNIVLDEVKEYKYAGKGGKRLLVGGGVIESMLLNGSHLCMIIPGDEPPPRGDNEVI
jgi:small nuclear ribonucleoprotein (snRNP)-like protein